MDSLVPGRASAVRSAVRPSATPCAPTTDTFLRHAYSQNSRMPSPSPTGLYSSSARIFPGLPVRPPPSHTGPPLRGSPGTGHHPDSLRPSRAERGVLSVRVVLSSPPDRTERLLSSTRVRVPNRPNNELLLLHIFRTSPGTRSGPSRSDSEHRIHPQNKH